MKLHGKTLHLFALIYLRSFFHQTTKPKIRADLKKIRFSLHLHVQFLEELYIMSTLCYVDEYNHYKKCMMHVYN